LEYLTKNGEVINIPTTKRLHQFQFNWLAVGVDAWSSGLCPEWKRKKSGALTLWASTTTSGASKQTDTLTNRQSTCKGYFHVGLCREWAPQHQGLPPCVSQSLKLVLCLSKASSLPQSSAEG
jgi:hypothetical protein